uniref:Uncharacterized protein n=1 Tax=Setaria viridis TaxID=4556 RepID=A0A4V6Y7T0_SETVI|nr:hypothetical protein SEVIR_9G385800v2 [Setaria viridis]
MSKAMMCSRSPWQLACLRGNMRTGDARPCLIPPACWLLTSISWQNQTVLCGHLPAARLLLTHRDSRQIDEYAEGNGRFVDDASSGWPRTLHRTHTSFPTCHRDGGARGTRPIVRALESEENR